MKKYILISALVIVVIAVISLLLPKKPIIVGGAVGDTNTTPRMIQVVGNGNGTYSSTENKYIVASLYNGDATDRVIDSIGYVYNALTTTSTSTAALTLTAATSTLATTISSNTNYLLNTTVATSTAFLYVASTTPGLTSTALDRVWPAGTYIPILSNATTSSSVWVVVRYTSE